MKTTKWLRSALLGGVAVSVMATGAQADELSDMKAQLEALQARVNTIETAPAATLPAGTNLLTVRRGQSKSLASMGYNVREGDIPADRGMTIAVTPTADLPAPVTEITVYGYTAGYLTWSDETMSQTGFWVPSVNEGSADEWNLYARARFGIKAKTDTAIGQVRAHMEFQATGTGGAGVALRHAYGTWAMTPEWTLLVGQTWRTASALDFGVSTVDTSGWAGPSTTRTPMVRLEYRSGPMTMKVALEDPTFASADYPNIAAYVSYSAAGGHKLWASAKVADYGTKTGWMVAGGANINLGDIAAFTGVVQYGRGEPRSTNFQVLTGRFRGGNPTKIFAAGAGLSFNVSETTTVNAVWGWTRSYNPTVFDRDSSVHTVHANIMWRPVKQMRLGWEVMWGRRNLAVPVAKQDAIRAAFGAWFFF
jgi:hypothetical protein